MRAHWHVSLEGLANLVVLFARRARACRRLRRLGRLGGASTLAALVFSVDRFDQLANARAVSPRAGRGLPVRVLVVLEGTVTLFQVGAELHEGVPVLVGHFWAHLNTDGRPIALAIACVPGSSGVFL